MQEVEEAPAGEVIDWPTGEPKSLDEALEDTVAALTKYVHFADDYQAHAVALWVAHTYLLDRCDATPRLAIRAPSKQAGKTRLMEVLRCLTPSGWHVVTPSAAVLYRSIEKRQPTILLDEADRLFEKKDEDNAAVIAVLNAGHERGVTVPRIVGPKLELHDFPAFAAVALAGIGTNWPDTIMDRSIVINMERKTSAEPVKRLRRDGKADLRSIGAQLAASLASVESLELEQHRLPAELSDRAQDGWEPLLAIADAAGPAWGKRARHAAVALADAGAVGNEEREELLLLRDIRAIFQDEGDPEFIPSARLHLRLLTITESPWNDGARPLSVHRIGSHMAVFGIKSKQPVRGKPRGYFLADIEPHWGRLGNGENLDHIVPAATPTYPEDHEDEAA